MAKKNVVKKGKRTYTKRKDKIEVDNSMEASVVFTLVDGLPITRMKITDAEREKISDMLDKLLPNKNHLVLPSKMKRAALRIVEMEFPKYAVKTHYNKMKKTIAIWRER